MKTNVLENEFNEEIHKIIREAKKHGYNPTRFLNMFASYESNGVAFANDLVSRKDLSDGFVYLCTRGYSNLTLEYLVTKHEYESLFDEKLIKIAKRKINNSTFKKAK